MADCDYDGDLVSWTIEDDCGLWTWTVEGNCGSLVVQANQLKYRTLREESREVGEGESFIDTMSLFHAINTYNNVIN